MREGHSDTDIKNQLPPHSQLMQSMRGSEGIPYRSFEKLRLASWLKFANITYVINSYSSILYNNTLLLKAYNYYPNTRNLSYLQPLLSLIEMIVLLEYFVYICMCVLLEYYISCVYKCMSFNYSNYSLIWTLLYHCLRTKRFG